MIDDVSGINFFDDSSETAEFLTGRYIIKEIDLKLKVKDNSGIIEISDYGILT